MSETGSGSPPLLIMHIPKTAGTSLRWIVEQQYPPGALHTLYPGHGPQLEALAAAAPAAPPVAVMGHFRFGLHARLPAGGRYVTFFRDPVDQVLSHYNYLTATDDPANGGVVRPEGGLTGFLTHGWARNLQTQYLTGLTPAEIEADPGRAFRRGLAVLAEHFLGFGIVERFPESVRLIADQLGWRVSACPVLNPSPAGPQRVHRRSLGEPAIRAIEDANACDLPLYEYVRAVVLRRLRDRPTPTYRRRALAAARRVAGRVLGTGA